MSPSLAFLACVEAGRLESQALLLCRSIRRFGGRYAGAALHTFQPRRGPALAARTLAGLRELGAVHHQEILNEELARCGPANKVFACAWAEERLAEEVLVFLDSDTVMTGEPAELDLPPGIVAAARPAESSALNSTGPGDPRDAYWRDLYAELGLAAEPYVETELGNRVRAFFSAGLVAARREEGLFRRWRETLLRLVREGRVHPEGGLDRMDEVALAAALVPVFERVRVLDPRYNYLIYRRARLAGSWPRARLEDLVHLHYRSCFHHPGYLGGVEPPLDLEGEVGRWLAPHLPLEPRLEGRLPV